MEPVEIEIKLSVLRPEVGRALVEAPGAAELAGFEADGDVHEAVVIDRYLDTAVPAGSLRAAGLRARLRLIGADVVLAIKGRGVTGADGVTTRMELEGPATADHDVQGWPPSPARSLLLGTIAGAPLVEIAAIRQLRRARLLRRDETVVELSLDELTALDGATDLATRLELEAELKAGPAAALSDLAAALAAIDGLAPALGSKLDFALVARHGDPLGR